MLTRLRLRLFCFRITVIFDITLSDEGTISSKSLRSFIIVVIIVILVNVVSPLPFFSDNNSEQLILQPLRSDHEVEQGDFSGQLRQVVRIA